MRFFFVLSFLLALCFALPVAQVSAGGDFDFGLSIQEFHQRYPNAVLASGKANDVLVYADSSFGADYVVAPPESLLAKSFLDFLFNNPFVKPWLEIGGKLLPEILSLLNIKASNSNQAVPNPALTQ